MIIIILKDLTHQNELKSVLDLKHHLRKLRKNIKNQINRFILQYIILLDLKVNQIIDNGQKIDKFKKDLNKILLKLQIQNLVSLIIRIIIMTCMVNLI